MIQTCGTICSKCTYRTVLNIPSQPYLPYGDKTILAPSAPIAALISGVSTVSTAVYYNVTIQYIPTPASNVTSVHLGRTPTVSNVRLAILVW